MMIRTTLLLLFLLLNQISVPQVASHDYVKGRGNYYGFPKPSGWVNDFENILADKEEKELEDIISRFEKKTSNEIAVVTVKDIEPYSDIADYAKDLFNHWGIGKKNLNNGLLIVFSNNLHEVRITTGYGTEKILTDAQCKKVIDNAMVPYFKNGEYYKGLKEGVETLIKSWK